MKMKLIVLVMFFFLVFSIHVEAQSNDYFECEEDRASRVDACVDGCWEKNKHLGIGYGGEGHQAFRACSVNCAESLPDCEVSPGSNQGSYPEQGDEPNEEECKVIKDEFDGFSIIEFNGEQYFSSCADDRITLKKPVCINGNFAYETISCLEFGVGFKSCFDDTRLSASAYCSPDPPEPYIDIIIELKKALEKPFIEQNDAISKIFAGQDLVDIIDILKSIKNQFEPNEWEIISGNAGNVVEKNIAMEAILEQLWNSDAKDLIIGDDDIVYSHILRDLLRNNFRSPGEFIDGEFIVGFDIRGKLATSNLQAIPSDPFEQPEKPTSWEDIIIERVVNEFVENSEAELYVTSNMKSPEEVEYEKAQRDFAEKNPNLDFIADIGEIPGAAGAEALYEVREMGILYEAGQLGVLNGAYHTAMMALGVVGVGGVTKKAIGGVEDAFKAVRKIKISDLSDEGQKFVRGVQVAKRAGRLSDDALRKIATIARSNAPRNTKTLSVIRYISHSDELKGVARNAEEIGNWRKFIKSDVLKTKSPDEFFQGNKISFKATYDHGSGRLYLASDISENTVEMVPIDAVFKVTKIGDDGKPVLGFVGFKSKDLSSTVREELRLATQLYNQANSFVNDLGKIK